MMLLNAALLALWPALPVFIVCYIRQFLIVRRTRPVFRAHRRLLIRVGIQPAAIQSRVGLLLFALLMDRIEYGSELLPFGRAWIDLLQPFYDP